ncbi:thyrotropin-releasing hormone receptor-like [Lingula anatina]|uniref:Thyrotropin-releasing hormone receptor n=1 Tax=Lingula anatina TaxID=7574 RepID=A0A1S3IZW5_LINAN|nr:thyrotropin-releasing hormone receptor-like [Lingula anatina]|eukprot:XP_013403735.1 thyrotropin-releasing hormone receptor-like [Lingula anatina]
MGINVSSLSITAFTVERYIAICHPMKAYSMCTVSRAKKIILCLWVFSGCYSAPWLALTKVTQVPNGNETYNACDYKLERDQYFIYYLVDLVMFYIFPLCLTALLYFLIGRVLLLSEEEGSVRNRNKTKVIATCQTNSNRATKEEELRGLRNRGKGIQPSTKQVLKMLIVVVVLFALLWLPYRALVVYNSVAAVRFDSIWFLMFCRHLISVNSAINPIIYNIMSTKFREAFRKACIACYGRCTPNTTGTTLLQQTNVCMTSL